MSGIPLGVAETMGVAEVRRYQPFDRASIEDVAYRTGFMGESSDAFWRHRESSASIWIAPYLDSEPDSTFVATVDGKVVGYLTGCVDTANFKGPDAVMMNEIVRHKLFFHAGVAGFLWRSIADRMRDKWHGHPFVSGELHDSRWPSHLHVNLLPEARGAGVGRALMEAWFARLRELRSPGCHLGVIAENQRAVAFFSAVGFKPYGDPVPIPGLRGNRGERLHQQMMVRAMTG